MLGTEQIKNDCGLRLQDRESGLTQRHQQSGRSAKEAEFIDKKISQAESSTALSHRAHQPATERSDLERHLCAGFTDTLCADGTNSCTRLNDCAIVLAGTHLSPSDQARF